MAAAAILFPMLASGWLLLQNSRLHREIVQTQSARQAGEQHARDLDRQLSAERAQSQELTSELQRLRTPPPPTLRSAMVSLLLNVGTTRGTDAGPTPTLVIAPQTSQVRLELALDHQDYPSYRVTVQPITGLDTFSRQHLRPRATKTGSLVALTVPAGRFDAGDYVVTLSGETSNLEDDAIGKSVFRVERK
jgi:hypothetical protein